MKQETPQVPQLQQKTKINKVTTNAPDQVLVEFTAKGYIDGFANGTFDPEKGITRAEFIKIANRVFGFTQKAEENFKDVNENALYYN